MVLNQEHLSPEEELVQDLLTITHVFSARLDGLPIYRHAEISTHNPAQSDDGSNPVL